MKRLLIFLLVTFLTVYSMTWLLAGGKEALIPFLGAVPNVPVVQGASGGTPLNTAMSAAADISGSSTLQHAGDAFTINVQGYGAVAFQIVGTLATNTIQWQSTLDGVTYDVFNVTSPGYSGGLFQSVNSATFYTGMVLEGATAAVNQLKFTTTGELGGLCTVYWRLSPLTIPGLNLTVTPLKSYFVPGADAVGTTATLANELNNAIYVLTRPQVYNGATWDRGRAANAAAGTTGTGLLGVGLLGSDSTNWQYLGVNGSHALKVDGSAVTQPVSGTVAVTGNTTGTPGDAFAAPGAISQAQQFPEVYNGTNWDRTRSANAAANTTGTGLAGAGVLGYDGANWQYTGVNASHALKVDDTAALKAGTGAETNVAASVTDVTLLAANANRLGASIYNDSTAVLYVLDAAATSSATVYTTQVPAGALYEVPFRYTGIIHGIWASAAGGARVCEFSP